MNKSDDHTTYIYDLTQGLLTPTTRLWNITPSLYIQALCYDAFWFIVPKKILPIIVEIEVSKMIWERNYLQNHRANS